MVRCNTMLALEWRAIMASQVFDTANNTVWSNLAIGVSERRARFSAWRAKRANRARIARELNTYTDRELFDLGIQRGDFAAILNGTFRR
jgi:uncharacterized protein YjiS (DUF1127 family)